MINKGRESADLHREGPILSLSKRVRKPLATQTDDLQAVEEVIENLDQATDNEDFVVPDPETPPSAADDLPLEMISLLRAGIDQMSSMEKVRDFPEFFLRYAQSTGLRLVLLKRWTSGLQVFMEENIQLPAEAKK